MFLCECNRANCMDRLPVEATEIYQAVMSALLYAMLDGHENLEEEEVVERHNGWLIVKLKEEG